MCVLEYCAVWPDIVMCMCHTQVNIMMLVLAGGGRPGSVGEGGSWFLGIPGPGGFQTLALGGGGGTPGLEGLLGMSYERCVCACECYYCAHDSVSID